MAVTITATVGASDANSFVTEAEAIAYMAERLNIGDWTTVTGSTCTEDEKKALVEATRDLNVVEWDGYRVTDAQALAWPRQWAVDPDSPSKDYFDTDEIPQRVKNATMELALQYIKAGTRDVAAIDSKVNVKRKKVDILETEYFSSAYTPEGLARYPRVANEIAPLLATSGMTVPVIRG